MAEYNIVSTGGKTGRIGLEIQRENLESIIGVNNWLSDTSTGKEIINITDMRYAGFKEGDSTSECIIVPKENIIHVDNGVHIEIPEKVMDKFVKKIKDSEHLRDNY